MKQSATKLRKQLHTRARCRPAVAVLHCTRAMCLSCPLARPAHMRSGSGRSCCGARLNVYCW